MSGSLFVAAAEDFVCEQFERRIEGGDKRARGEFHAWWESCHDGEFGQPMQPPNFDLADHTLVARTIWSSFDVRLRLAIDHANSLYGRNDPPDPDVLDNIELDGDFLLAQMQASMAVGW